MATESENYSKYFLFIGLNNKLDWCCLVNFPAYSLSLDGHYIQRPRGSLSGTCGDGKLLLAKPWSTDFHWVSLSRQNWSWLERGKAAWMNAIMDWISRQKMWKRTMYVSSHCVDSSAKFQPIFTESLYPGRIDWVKLIRKEESRELGRRLVWVVFS